MTLSKEAIDTLTGLGAAVAVKVLDIQGMPATLVPNGYSLDLHSKLLPKPQRNCGIYKVESSANMAELFDQLDQRDASTRPSEKLFVSVRERLFVLVLNDATLTEPGHGDFRILYKPIHSPEWTAWTKLAKAGYVSQLEFAEFLDDWRQTITAPDAADIVEIATDLQGARNAEWRSGTRLQNGSVQLAYVEDIRGTSKGREIQVPERMTLTLPIFDGEVEVPVDVRLRWALDEGKVKFKVVLPPSELIERPVLESMAGFLHEKTGLVPVYGSPR